MSVIRCEACDAIFDSDEDPDCFVEVGNMRRLHKTLILCEHCRDERDIEQERQASQQAWWEGQAELYAAEGRQTNGESHERSC